MEKSIVNFVLFNKNIDYNYLCSIGMDCKINVDDNSEFRQHEVFRSKR